jgi:hypothetical protein
LGNGGLGIMPSHPRSQHQPQRHKGHKELESCPNSSFASPSGISPRGPGCPTASFSAALYFKRGPKTFVPFVAAPEPVAHRHGAHGPGGRPCGGPAEARRTVAGLGAATSLDGPESTSATKTRRTQRCGVTPVLGSTECLVIWALPDLDLWTRPSSTATVAEDLCALCAFVADVDAGVYVRTPSAMRRSSRSRVRPSEAARRRTIR